MKKRFDILILEEALEFLQNLDPKHYKKVLYNIRKSQNVIDDDLFKKLQDDIWEFRTLYQGIQYRLLAFWDKTDRAATLVVATHGLIKKSSKMPDNDIQKAKVIREEYFKEKSITI